MVFSFATKNLLKLLHKKTFSFLKVLFISEPRPDESGALFSRRLRRREKTKDWERKAEKAPKKNYFLTLFGFLASSLALASSTAFWAASYKALSEAYCLSG